MKVKSRDSGKLRIGDDWNAIRIIALSQSNPLKAIAEFVENSIDAHAKTITITRGKEHGAQYLIIKDDGEGVPRNEDGLPDFKYVATHICDSIKRRLKADGNGAGLQGEFGIGLLSFWTVGDTLTMTSTGAGHVDVIDSEHISGKTKLGMTRGGQTMTVETTFSSKWLGADCPVSPAKKQP